MSGIDGARRNWQSRPSSFRGRFDVIKSEGYAMAFAMFEIWELGLDAINFDSGCLSPRHGAALVALRTVAAVSVSGCATHGWW
jgi:hypothetical protein